MKNKNTKQSKHSHPGRPRYDIKWPKSREFTKKQICETNDIDMRRKVNGKLNGNWGKGPCCTLLTINKGVARDLAKRGHSVLIRLKETAEPDSESGLGRRATLYCLRVKGASVKHATVAPKVSTVKTPRKARTPKSTSQTPTADKLDAIHAILAQPSTPTPALTVPAVVIAPEAPAPAPEAAPAPAAPVAEVAPAAPVATLANS
jgi:hypothetical protein